MPKYNHRYETDDDGSVYELWTNRSGTETFVVDLTAEEDDDEPEEGCSACGNPAYPDCKSSFPLFDD